MFEIFFAGPEANPSYSGLTATSMFKAGRARIVECAMVNTWVKCNVLGSSIHIHRSYIASSIPSKRIRSKQSVSI